MNKLSLFIAALSLLTLLTVGAQVLDSAERNAEITKLQGTWELPAKKKLFGKPEHKSFLIDKDGNVKITIEERSKDNIGGADVEVSNSISDSMTLLRIDSKDGVMFMELKYNSGPGENARIQYKLHGDNLELKGAIRYKVDLTGTWSRKIEGE